MPTSEQRLRELEEIVEAMTARVDGIGTRLTGVASIASQHGGEHNDLGLDPIEAGDVEGHAHTVPKTPVVEATNTSTSSLGTSHTVDLPANIVADNLLIVFFSHGGGPTLTWPGGWTEFVDFSDQFLNAAYRFADGTEGASITVTSSEAMSSAHNTYRISAAYQQAPEAATATGSSPAADPPSLTPIGGSKEYLWIAAVAAADPTAPPSGYEGFITAPRLKDCASAYRIIVTATEDPGAFTNGAATWNAVTVSIAPAADVEFGLTLTQHAAISDDTPHHPESHPLTSHSDKLFDLATEDLAFVDAGSAGATELDWLEVTIGGNTGYIRVFAAK